MPDEDSLSTKARRTPWNKGKLMSESPGQSGHALPIGHQPLRAKSGQFEQAVWPDNRSVADQVERVISSSFLHLSKSSRSALVGSVGLKVDFRANGFLTVNAGEAIPPVIDRVAG